MLNLANSPSIGIAGFYHEILGFQVAQGSLSNLTCYGSRSLKSSYTGFLKRPRNQVKRLILGYPLVN